MAAKPNSREELQQAVDATTAHGSKAAAARILGIPEGTFRSRLNAAARLGVTPNVQRLIATEPAAAPEGYRLKGTSTYFDAEGVPRAQWVKTNADAEALAAMQRAAFEALCAELPPYAPIACPKTADADLVNVHTLTDAHIGALAWAKESGEDWDLDIAERCIVGTFAQMIDASPAARVGILNQLGDCLHYDSLQALTPSSKHVLDTDSRYQKVVAVTVRILRRLIDMMLAKYPIVHVKMMEGNHDPVGSVWLRVMLAMVYEQNKRVTVDQSPNPYSIYLHGSTLLGFYHGHLAKMDSIPGVFAQQFRSEWGQSAHTYVHVGHLHHTHEKEFPGVNIIQHPTLAAKDAYAARYGFLSRRQLVSMTYHKARGEVRRGIFVPT